jgi:hypothetical protein
VTTSPRALAYGLAAALLCPLYVGGQRLSTLMACASAAASASDPQPAVRVAHGALRRLARLPFSPWRSTCLYRSIAECLVLRWLGVPGCVRIGVRNDGSPDARVLAHAWVERSPSQAAAEGVDYTVLRRSAPARES